MEFFAIVKLSTEQTAEDTQAQGVGLADIGGGGQPVADLSQQHTSQDGGHQTEDHLEHFVGGSLTDGLIDEATAQPHHQQAAHYLSDACYDMQNRIQTDATQVAPKPRDVLHSTTFTFCHSLTISVTS